MKKYIENIRASVKKQGYTPTSDIIREAINTVCPDGENILENKSTIVKEVIQKLTPSQEIEQVADVESAQITYSQSDTGFEEEIKTNTSEYSIPESIITDFPDVPQPEQKEGGEIIVSEEEKHDLITSQASVLGFTLSEEDATCIASTVDEIFESYTHLIDTISTAIKSYFDHRFDSVESSLESNSENLREHFASRKEKLNQKIAGFKNDVKADLGGIRNDIKSVQFAFTERLRIPAKS
ncbi:hypothetical protein NIES4071_109310 (plasmid) [Calothrix sp. NIES-4071]|nr:hypothetical protein NIES4071_109310 [Calothrix sp. NIES-4071]BAZ65194.1 hypothetical protein NIES4105_109270 [Calothrix sp. NIES-4105]